MLSATRQTPIMKASGIVEYPAHIVVRPESALVFYDAETFGSADSMFHTYSSRRYILVLCLLLRRKLSTFWLLCRLHDHGICRSVSLIAGILPKLAQKREIILRVGDCLVVHVSFASAIDLISDNVYVMEFSEETDLVEDAAEVPPGSSLTEHELMIIATIMKASDFRIVCILILLDYWLCKNKEFILRMQQFSNIRPILSQFSQTNVSVIIQPHSKYHYHFDKRGASVFLYLTNILFAVEV